MKLPTTQLSKYLIVVLLSLIFFSFIQFTTDFGDPDAFYHAKIIKMMQRDPIVSEFPYTQFSTLKDIYTDHHFFYHLTQLPLSYIFNPLMTVKVFNVLINTLFIFVFYWFLVKRKIPLRWLLLTIIFLSTPFIFRLSLIKANALALIFLLILIHFIFKSFETKTWLNCFYVFMFSCFFVLSYGGWIIIWPIIFLLFISQLISRQLNLKKTIGLTISLLLGLILGIIIHPYFPNNLIFFKQQIFDIGLINFQDQINVGTEWYQTTFREMISSLRIILVFTIIAFVLNVLNYKKTKTQTIFFFLVMLFFTFFTIKSRRYVEYLVPFAVLFIGQSFKQNISLLTEFYSESKIYFFKIPYIIASIILGTLLLVNIILSYSFLWINLNKFPFSFYQSAGNFITTVIPNQSTVFHTAWDEWPALFYYTDNLYFIGGLDPTFSYLFNPDKHILWQDIADGKIIKNIDQIIPTEFNSNFIVASKRYYDLINQLQTYDNISLIFEDQNSLVYVIKE